ncbi:MAG: Rid family detoxifying hydrolase [Oscillospiraceae bacterium]|nr:Rid family detoxifying hydrolase [Oscillospiraceae bacterium]
MKEIIFTENAPFPVGPYSQAVLVNGTLYASGQIAMDALDADVATQTHKVCENVTAVLAAAGMTRENVVKTTCFLTDMADFATFNGVYEQYFAHKPARSTVAAKQLPKDALVEIEVIAVQ